MDNKKTANKPKATGTSGMNEDITGRKHEEEEEIAKQKKIMAQAEELAGIGSWEWDMINDTWLFSDNWLKIHGCTNSRLTTSELLPIAHPEDRAAIKEAFSRATEKGEPYTIEHRIIRQDTGEIKYVKAKGIIEFDESGKQKAMIGVVQDITKGRQAEDALRESEEKFRVLANSAKVMISIIGDPQGLQYLYVNEEWQHVFGYSKEEALKIKPIDTVAPDHRQMVLDYAVKRLAGQNPATTYELKVITKNGETRYLDFSSTVISFGKQKALLTTSIDITERKQTEEKLRESEDRLSSAFNYAAIGMAFVSPEGQWLKVNPAIPGMFGYTEEELLSKTFQDITHPDDLNKDLDYVMQMLEGSIKTYQMEKRYFHKSGKIIWALLSVSLVRDQNGNPLHFISQIQDITERKQAEYALRESEARFKSIIAVSNTGAWEYHKDIDYLWCSPEYFTMLGRNPAHFKIGGSANLAESWIDLIHPDDREKASHSFADYLAGGSVGMYESYFRMKHSKGGWVWIWSRGQTLRDSYGNLTQRTVGTHIDITKSKQAEESLSKSEAIKNKMVSNIGDVIVIIDKDGINRYKSPNIEKWFGWKPEDLVGKSTWDNVHPEDMESVQKFFLSLAGEAAASGTMELRYRKKDGSYCPIKINVVNLLQDPDIQGFLGNYHDITDIKEREKLEAEILIANKSLRFKQNFLANMSHEIRTPLTGVLGMIEIMEQTSLTNQQIDYLNTIKSSGENLREIINQVLDYSKIEAGKIILQPRIFEFISLPASAISLSENNLMPGVKLQSITDPEIPLLLEADNARLSQVLNNLVSNAVKFTTQGLITIQSSLKSSDTQNGQVVIKVEVSDTGLGIPDDLQENLFTPFAQVEAADARNFEGTGLGLSICKELVEMMDGEIGMVSEVGKGSTFWFTFPAKTVRKPPLPAQKKESPITEKKLCILLAEDKIVTQKVVKLMLSAMGHKVTIANNGQEALDVYRPGQFDLILMDIQMPVMDGITATQKLKEKYQSLPPIVGLSANAFEGDRIKYMSLGMDEYLTKPVKKGDFEGLIGRLFQ